MKNANRLSTITTDSTVYTFTYDGFGNTTGISAGDNQLASYEYHPYNGKLKWLNYGNGLKVKYLYDSIDRISEICYNTGEGGVEHMLVYLYDEKGAPIGLKYRTSGYDIDSFQYYFFEKNLQGDIVAVYNDAGDKIGTYSYDAWGVCTAIATSGVSAIDRTVVTTYNPFRYRGYYYDVETGWYYLQSRYYNPNWCRFINADGYVSTGTGLLGYNMFVYCNNNPISLSDSEGEFPFLALAIIGLGAIIGGVLGYNSDEKLLDNKNVSIEENEQTTDTSSLEHNVSQPASEPLTVRDKIENAVIGATGGILVGGAIVATGGVIGTVALKSTTALMFGATGPQTFAIGALAVDSVAYVIGPLLGIEVEPIEYEEMPMPVV